MIDQASVEAFCARGWAAARRECCRKGGQPAWGVCSGEVSSASLAYLNERFGSGQRMLLQRGLSCWLINLQFSSYRLGMGSSWDKEPWPNDPLSCVVPGESHFAHLPGSRHPLPSQTSVSNDVCSKAGFLLCFHLQPPFNPISASLIVPWILVMEFG